MRGGRREPGGPVGPHHLRAGDPRGARGQGPAVGAHAREGGARAAVVVVQRVDRLVERPVAVGGEGDGARRPVEGRGQQRVPQALAREAGPGRGGQHRVPRVVVRRRVAGPGGGPRDERVQRARQGVRGVVGVGRVQCYVVGGEVEPRAGVGGRGVPVVVPLVDEGRADRVVVRVLGAVRGIPRGGGLPPPAPQDFGVAGGAQSVVRGCDEGPLQRRRELRLRQPPRGDVEGGLAEHPLHRPRPAEPARVRRVQQRGDEPGRQPHHHQRALGGPQLPHPRVHVARVIRHGDHRGDADGAPAEVREHRLPPGLRVGVRARDGAGAPPPERLDQAGLHQRLRGVGGDHPQEVRVRLRVRQPRARGRVPDVGDREVLGQGLHAHGGGRRAGPHVRRDEPNALGAVAALRRPAAAAVEEVDHVGGGHRRAALVVPEEVSQGGPGQQVVVDAVRLVVDLPQRHAERRVRLDPGGGLGVVVLGVEEGARLQRNEHLPGVRRGSRSQQQRGDHPEQEGLHWRSSLWTARVPCEAPCDAACDVKPWDVTRDGTTQREEAVPQACPGLGSEAGHRLQEHQRRWASGMC